MQQITSKIHKKRQISSKNCKKCKILSQDSGKKGKFDKIFKKKKNDSFRQKIPKNANFVKVAQKKKDINARSEFFCSKN